MIDLVSSLHQISAQGYRSSHGGLRSYVSV